MVGFGRLMRRAREAKRMSLALLGDQLGFTPVHLSEVERGRRNPPKEGIVRQWAGILDVPEEEAVDAAKESVDIVKIPVNRDPRKAEVALAFLREIDGNRFSDEKREKILEILNEE